MIDFRDLYQLEMDVIPVINQIEKRGLCWDSRLARREDRKVRAKMQVLLDSDTMAGVNPGSPKQVKRHFLELGMPEKLLLKKGKVTTGQEQIDAAVRKLENDERWRFVPKVVVKRVSEFSKCLTDYRHLAKVSGTYLRPFSDVAERTGGVVYPSLNPFGAVTGRMSGTMQQMPKATERMTPEQQIVRQCVMCRPGYATYYFDYEQMEMAVFGAVSGERRIIDGYAAGEDIHQTMADAIGQPRDLTKNINFGIIYGEGATKLADALGVGLAKAKELRDMYFREFPAIKEYQDELERELRANGFVQDWFGRRYSLKHGEAYKAVNAVVQGCCASIFKRALIEIAKELPYFDAYAILVVHDETQIEMPLTCKREKRFIRSVTTVMQQIEELTDRGLLLKVDCKKTVTNWAEKQPV